FPSLPKPHNIWSFVCLFGYFALMPIAIRIYYKDPLSARTLEKASLGQQKRIIGFPQLQFYIITLTGPNILRLFTRKNQVYLEFAIAYLRIYLTQPQFMFCTITVKGSI